VSTLIEAALFDVDGTLIDSVDIHALAWQRAFIRFGHDISFAKIRHQIGKGGDKLIPVFLSARQQAEYGKALETWRGDHLKAHCFSQVRPFSSVPELLRRTREAGLQNGIVSSAKKDELSSYLAIAGVEDLVDQVVSSEDVSESKPAPDAFEIALRKLQLRGDQAIAVGDTPYDAEAARKASITTIGVLSGGFDEADLRRAGCLEIYPGPATLFACFEETALNKR
jgi:HAD superfamily hydrolase (TIGR01549 family)